MEAIYTYMMAFGRVVIAAPHIVATIPDTDRSCKAMSRQEVADWMRQHGRSKAERYMRPFVNPDGSETGYRA